MNLRYIFSLISTFLSKFKGVLLIGIVSGIIVFLILRTFGPIIWGRETEKIGVVGKYSLDNIPYYILNLVSAGLTKIADDGTAEPAIATSWENKDDGKTWTFHLNENKYWQDGKKITSQSIKLNFSDIKEERPDEATLVFKLQSPFAPLANIVSRPVFKKGFLGNGEWEVKKITVSGNNVKKLVIADKEKNKKIYYFYPTEDRAKLALKLGEIDYLNGIFNPQPFDKWKTLKVEKNIDYGKYVAVLFNTKKEKPGGDKSFRQALSYTINKDVFEGPRAISPISPNSWAYNPQVKPYNYDSARAAELIKDLPKELKNELSIELITTPVLAVQAEKIAKDWGAIGVKTNIRVTPSIPDQFDALLAIFDVPQDPDQYTLWHSSQKNTNLANYQNPRIDKLLEDGRTEMNREARKKIYLDFQRFLVEDSPAIFLYHPISYTISRK